MFPVWMESVCKEKRWTVLEFRNFDFTRIYLYIQVWRMIVRWCIARHLKWILSEACWVRLQRDCGCDSSGERVCEGVQKLCGVFAQNKFHCGVSFTIVSIPVILKISISKLINLRNVKKMCFSYYTKFKY